MPPEWLADSYASRVVTRRADSIPKSSMALGMVGFRYNGGDGVESPVDGGVEP